MNKDRDLSLIIAISGASGAVYAKGFFDFIHENTRFIVKLVISENGLSVLKNELNIGLSYFDKERVIIYDNKNLNVNIASGSAKSCAMVIIPASMGSIARIANGISHDLIGRTADVALKERQKLIIVPREAPLNNIHLKNMLSISRMGGIIIPASPGFYHKPDNINDLIDFIVSKVLNQLGIENDLVLEWNPEKGQ